MIKLLFLGTKDIDDKLAWSGTMYRMMQSIMSEDRYVVSSLKIPGLSFGDRIRIKLTTLVGKLFNSNRSYIGNVDVKQATLNGKRLSKLVATVVDKNSIDVIFAPGLSTYLTNLKTDIPIIYLSDATFSLMNDYYWFGLSQTDINNGNYIEQAALSNATSIILSSTWAANSALRDYKIPVDKVNILPFGANLAIDTLIEPKTLKSENVIKILLVGTDYKRKGVNIAEQVVHLLNERSNIHYQLIVVGIDAEDNADVHYAGLLNKENQEDYDKLVNYYQEAKLFLLPTRAEASAIVYAEASMFGLPTLTFDTGGSGDYVINEVNGYRVSLDSPNIIAAFADKIDEIISDERLYNRLSVGALEQYQKQLNWNQWLIGFNKIVDHVLTKESEK
ncbi:glycosyltransferase family 4 protein [Latilactobacillus curvatus]|uniref:Glycosyl transferase family 1 domain-containing protein n=1 Tax=Latilactobacillus curvatus TaxID=28038 RepID=A0AAC9ULU8_LATCU|nr:glycosyltransferase family 4 protein [Latilactobacillus curvatus]ASN59518.1 hypothetical protein CG419_02305 [Latilactobacillus curvatus]